MALENPAWVPCLFRRSGAGVPIAFRVEIEVAGHHRFPQIGKPVDRSHRRESRPDRRLGGGFPVFPLLLFLQRGLEVLDILVNANAPGKAAGVDHIVDLPAGNPASFSRFKHGEEDLLAERGDVGIFFLGIPVEEEEIARRNVPQLGVVIGNTQRIGALRVDHQQDVLRTAGCPRTVRGGEANRQAGEHGREPQDRFGVKGATGKEDHSEAQEVLEK